VDGAVCLGAKGNGRWTGKSGLPSQMKTPTHALEKPSPRPEETLDTPAKTPAMGAHETSVEKLPKELREAKSTQEKWSPKLGFRGCQGSSHQKGGSGNFPNLKGKVPVGSRKYTLIKETP